MPGLALFAYASLVEPESAARSLGRVPEAEPARLPGWRRRWSAYRDNLTTEKTFARRDDGSIPRHVVALNLELLGEGEAGANGALLELTEEELRRLDVREMRYRRVDVTGHAGEGGFDRVFAYTAREVHYSPEPPPDAVIIAAYVRALEQAFAALGPDQQRIFRETTDPPPVEVIEAVLIRDWIPPGNPREW